MRRLLLPVASSCAACRLRTYANFWKKKITTQDKRKDPIPPVYVSFSPRCIKTILTSSTAWRGAGTLNSCTRDSVLKS